MQSAQGIQIDFVLGKQRALNGNINKKTSIEKDLMNDSREEMGGSRQNIIQETQQKPNIKQEAPIYQLKSYKFKFQAKIQPNDPNDSSYFAQGDLVGYFYNFQEPVRLANIMFIGDFEGAIQKDQNDQSSIYFQGIVKNFKLINSKIQKCNQPMQFAIKELQQPTSFKGYFKGNFYSWNDIKSLKDIPLSNENLPQIENKIKEQTEILNPITNKVLNQIQMSKTQTSPDYFLPTVVRFEIQDIREINLEKSMAVISGVFHIEIHYNDTIKEYVRGTNDFLRRKRRELKEKGKGVLASKYEKLLKIELNFQRDFNLTLSLEEEDEDDESGNDSQGSEWSIMDKTWDIDFEDDQQKKVYRFRVWKRFNTEIDNSYGAFFAPFNLSVLRIVMTLHHFLVKQQNGNNLKVHLIGTELKDYDMNSGYNPFSYFNQLQPNNIYQIENQYAQMNRLHKINRFGCKDSGTFIIADNRLTLYPYFKNILINKNTANDDFYWNIGVRDKLSRLEVPCVRSIPESFEYYYDSQTNKKRVETFAFHKWNYVIVEVPVYKYIVIDMLQVFVPLTLLSVISLLIFNQTNGISGNSTFTTLAYRLVSVCSLLIAYVSLIPVIRASLPPMPGITLVQILAYTLTVPNFLSLGSSMTYYTMSLKDWIADYRVFYDGLFVIAFVLTCICAIVVVGLFIGYILKDYNAVNPTRWPQQVAGNKYANQYCGPQYLPFMQQVKAKRAEYNIYELVDSNK